MLSSDSTAIHSEWKNCQSRGLTRCILIFFSLQFFLFLRKERNKKKKDYFTNNLSQQLILAWMCRRAVCWRQCKLEGRSSGVPAPCSEKMATALLPCTWRVSCVPWAWGTSISASPLRSLGQSPGVCLLCVLFTVNPWEVSGHEFVCASLLPHLVLVDCFCSISHWDMQGPCLSRRHTRPCSSLLVT